MKVLIGYPPIQNEKGVPLLSQNRQFQYFNNPCYIFPLVPASAATLLKENEYDVVFKDCIVEGVSEEEFIEFYKTEEFSIFCFETKTPVIKEHWRIIDKLKEIAPKTKIVIMGDHVTALPEETMEKSKVDFVLTGGDYDFMLLNLCNYLSGKESLEPGFYFKDRNEKIKSSGKFKLNHNLDKLPMIDRELANAKLYNVEGNIKVRPFAYIMSGRDCPWHKCKFCSWPTLYPVFRTRSVKNTIKEIQMLVEKYRVKEIFDDSGTFPPGKWLKEFCEAMVSTGLNKKIHFSCNMRVDYITEESAQLMKEAGFRLLKIGLESGNQETLDKLCKGIKVEQIREACAIAKKHGLTVHLTMIVGYPWETKEMALKTYELAKELMLSGKADVLQSTIVMPYPGTGLHEQALKEKWFRIDPEEYEKYDMSEQILNTPDMTPEEVNEVCRKIYHIFLHPRYVLKRLLEIRSAEDVKFFAKGAMAVVGHIKDFGRK